MNFDLSYLLNLLLSLLTALFVSAPVMLPVSVPAETVAVVKSVVDGDTIIVSQDGKEETVRYIGIDTPEPRREGAPECGSHEATEYNRQLVAGKTVRLVADAEDRDKYERLLRYVYVGEGDDVVFVNRVMVRDGLATPLTIKPNDTYADDFRSDAATAKSEGRGNWALCPDF